MLADIINVYHTTTFELQTQGNLHINSTTRSPWPVPQTPETWDRIRLGERTKQDLSLCEATGVMGRQRERGGFGKEEGKVLYPEAPKIN